VNLATITRRRTERRRSVAQVAHLRENGLHATLVGRSRLREFHITVVPLAGESIDSLVKRLHAFVAAHHAILVREEIFGLRSAAPEFFKCSAAVARGLTWPVQWLEGEPVGKGTIAGVHAFAVAGADVQWLFVGGRAVASIFSDGYARHCILSGIVPNADLEPRAEQADEIFDLIEHQLLRAKMDWKNVARTWIYLDRILEWYGEFNLVRKDAFDRLEIYSHSMPASTGIGVSNLVGAALTAGAWAVLPLRSEAQVEPVISPLQCSARDYGSCFSRAVEISAPDMRRLLISGTASISRDGMTGHVGDFAAQVNETFEVVEAILNSRNMRWKDVSRATAYLRNAKDAAAFAQFLSNNGYNLPLVTTRADVCRDDLLFELEVDAVVSTARPLRSDWDI
jgi:enamine deaminase RidA (YjgF/YER057c/UK114 family)